MTLNEFKAHIDRLVASGYGDALVVSASNGEGNVFSEVMYEPTKGIYYRLSRHTNVGDFFSEGELSKAELEEFGDEVKAVCVN